MDDSAFLYEVQDLLAGLVGEDVVVTAVRPVGGRPWPRVEVAFRLADPPPAWRGQTQGSAYAPLAPDWRYATGREEPSGYAQLLADEVERAARRLVSPRPPATTPSPEQVAERWHWLLDRLALNGTVHQEAHGRLAVIREDGTSFTVLVTPEQWALIGEPLDPQADDPQDFNQLNPEDTYLVFYEDDLIWSTRPELPPIGWGAEIGRQIRQAIAQGRTDVGWYAYAPGDPDGPVDPDRRWTPT
ncbi:hypothetical protein ACFFOS_27390 [Nocardioides kongjuensis]|uniref:Uncharacterized protein n=1 Tax=Nocardioides kongjuensis TaxID=349522 RepID=A0A852RXZ9_9ACTN|nr:hypothetical protein [Nocardioides kongjuensis]NYD32724.1 hypothetical protein [Nocardioides kongjuensis]